jgi:hypothetical protein
MGTGASVGSPMAELGDLAARLALGEMNGGPEETSMKVKEISAAVAHLQGLRDDIAAQSKLMSESPVLEQMSSDEMVVEKREAGMVHTTTDGSKSMEEYPDGTTIRRVEGSIERQFKDGTVQQISAANEVTERNAAGDLAVLAEHDTLLNQKKANGVQIQVGE